MKYLVAKKESTDQEQPFSRVPVHGHRIVIERFEDISFFVHRPFPEDERYGEYVISEKTTGAQLAQGHDLRYVMHLTISMLGIHGREGLERAIAWRLKMINIDRYVKASVATEVK